MGRDAQIYSPLSPAVSFLFLQRPALGSLIVLLSVVLVAGTGCRGGANPSADGSSETATAPVGEERHAGEHGGEHAELALHMSRLQRWFHKTALSVEARNQRLADFYLHETEETVETIQTEVQVYEGYEIGRLTKEYLPSTLDSLGQAVHDANWPVADKRLRQLTTSCNQCHDATDHGFVKIQIDSLPNPYTQSFAPQEVGR